MGTQHQNHPASAAHEGEQNGLLYSGGGGEGGCIPKISIVECKSWQPVQDLSTVSKIVWTAIGNRAWFTQGLHKARKRNYSNCCNNSVWQSMFCNTWPITSHITLNGLRQLWRKLTTIPATDLKLYYIYYVLQHRDSAQSWVVSWLCSSTETALSHGSFPGCAPAQRQRSVMGRFLVVLQHRDSTQSWVVSWLCSSTETALSHGSFPGCYRVSLSLCCESPAPVANSLFDWIKSLPRFGKNRQWKDHSSQLCKLNLSP